MRKKEREREERGRVLHAISKILEYIVNIFLDDGTDGKKYLISNRMRAKYKSMIYVRIELQALLILVLNLPFVHIWRRYIRLL